MFNFFILTVADVLSFGVKNADGKWNGLYIVDSSSLMLIICGLASNVILLVVTWLLCKKKIVSNTTGKIITFATGLFTLASYIVFLILSNTIVL